MNNTERYERAKRVAQDRKAAVGTDAGAMALESALRSQQRAAEEATQQQERVSALEIVKEQTLGLLDASGFPGIRNISLGRGTTSRKQPATEPGWYLFTEHGKPELDRYDGHPPYRDEYYLMADGTIRQRNVTYPNSELRIATSVEIAGDSDLYDRAFRALQGLAPGEPT